MPEDSSVEASIALLRQLLDAGEFDEAERTAFNLARAVAIAIAAPVEIDVRGGPGASFPVLYRVVAVDWIGWSSDDPMEPRSAHLLRTYRDPRGAAVSRDTRIVGRHPESARPRFVDEPGIEVPILEQSKLGFLPEEIQAVWAQQNTTGAIAEEA